VRVHSGELVVSKLADAGRVIRMARLEPGDFFGEMTLIEMQNRSANVVAESPAVHTSSRPENSTRAARPTFMRM
jgi:CRP-like cAMP-binding protein